MIFIKLFKKAVSARLQFVNHFIQAKATAVGCIVIAYDVTFSIIMRQSQI